MKVLDLACAQGHEFEGWFTSENDYRAQKASDLISCPMCGDTRITRKLSAPHLNLGRGKPPAKKSQAENTATRPEADTVAALPAGQLEAAWLRMVREVMTRTEDVGAGFAEEARRIHYGEAKERGIRGQATTQETRELLDEGIAVMPLPLPESMKGPLQ